MRIRALRTYFATLKHTCMEIFATLARDTFSSPYSGFYRTLWEKTGFNSAKDAPLLSELPLLSRDHLSYTPLPQRLYCAADNEGLFMKIIRHPGYPAFLIGKTKACITQENYGETPYTRPLISMRSSHESLEKGLWMYERGLLPLIAEDNHTITLMAAERYAADAIIADCASLETFLHVPPSSSLRTSVIHIQCLDSTFNPSLLKQVHAVFPHATLSLTLSLPEVGPLAHSCPHTPSTNPLFHPDPLSHITHNPHTNTLVVTRAAYLPTPIFNYDTMIPITMHTSTCVCATPYALSLTSTP